MTGNIALPIDNPADLPREESTRERFLNLLRGSTKICNMRGLVWRTRKFGWLKGLSVLGRKGR